MKRYRYVEEIATRRFESGQNTQLYGKVSSAIQVKET